MKKIKCNPLNCTFSIFVMLLCLSTIKLSAQVEVDNNSDVWIGGNVGAPNPNNAALNVFGRMTMRYPGPFYSNILIGSNQGNPSMTGSGNILMGDKNGEDLTSGAGNVLLGKWAGLNLTSGSSNVVLGPLAGTNITNSSYNFFLGVGTGNNFGTIGSLKPEHNVLIGQGAGSKNAGPNLTCSGANNILIGRDAGSYIQGGALDNVAIGTFSMVDLHTGSFNTAIGFQSLGHIQTGQRNVAIGAYAGDYNTGSNNVFIGYKVGEANINNPTTYSSRLYIDNSNTTTPLIYGEFNTNLVRINGNFETTGTASASCGVLSCSDVRYKKNFTPLNNALTKLHAITGVYYDWNTEAFPDKGFDDFTYLGFKAQEVEQQFPEMVRTDKAGYKSVDYSRMTVVLVEAMKEQQTQIESLEKENEELKRQVAIIAAYIEKQSDKSVLSAALKTKK